MKVDFSRLNQSQTAAVKAYEGPFLIPAAAGVGKTTVLTNRVVNLIGHHGVNPANILLTTFSKKAADEIKERMAKIINKRVLEDITIGTFHSIGHRILRMEYKKMNNAMYTAFEEKDVLSGKPQKWIVEAIIKQLNYTNIGSAEALKIISLAKGELLNAEKFALECIEEKDFQIAEIYRLYEEHKKEEKLIDFDDMLMLLYELFKNNPAILAKYQERFKFIMVDEAQDNSYIQYKIVELLAQKYENIFLVGDDDQTIFCFKGAKPAEFIDFKNKYKNITVIKLEKNYRSVPAILNLSNELIEKNTIRLPKKMEAFRTPVSQQNDEIKYYRATNEDHEAELVAKRVLEIAQTGKKYSDCTVLFRTSAQTRSLEDHFIQNSIPYIIIGGTSFYERAEVKDIIAYMNLAVDKHDDESFKRVINTPSRYIGKALLTALTNEAKKRRCSLFDAVRTVRVTPAQHRNITGFYDIIVKLNQVVAANKSNVELIKEIRTLTKYDEFLKGEGTEEDSDVLENINALESAAAKHPSTKSFLNFIKILTSNKVNKIDAVKMMTIHKSKGLEFPHTLVVGFCNNLLPHRYAVESMDPIAIEEERRLAYVAFTRAEDTLDVFSPSMYNGKQTPDSLFAVDCDIYRYLSV